MISYTHTKKETIMYEKRARNLKEMLADYKAIFV